MPTQQKIKYIREEIPKFQIPSYNGQRYEALVPDTLDLQERTTLAINGLTGPTDPKADYELYWMVYFRHNPAMMNHDWNDQVQAKFWEALPLMRLISGSALNMHVEQRWMEVMLHILGPDGLAYFPAQGRQWARMGRGNIFGTSKDTDHFTIPYFNGRLLSAITVYFLLTGEQVWKDSGKGIVKGLTGLVIDKGSYAYFPAGDFSFGELRPKDADMPTHMESSLAGWVIHGLVHYFRATGYEPALSLAGKLVTYLKDYGGYYDSECRFLPNGTLEGQQDFVHFHHHTMPMLAMLEHGLITKDRELVEFVRKGYEYGKANGNVLVGYFPENVGHTAPMTSETCEIADMVAIGLKLTLAGAGDYWDDVDRWVRNQFAENQLLNVDWVYRLAEQVPPSSIDNTYQTADRVPERNIGAFAGWPSANDWFGCSIIGQWTLPHHFAIMHCCTGNATRALYYVWENILHHTNGKLRINMLLNRASPWADVDSHIPYIGQVDVKIKKELELMIRIPEWVKPEEVHVTVNGSNRKVTFEGRYAKAGMVKTDDVVTMTFPIVERTDKVFIEKKEYALVRKGNDVVCIDPPGRWCPLYQRAHYRVNDTRWRKITRFVTEKEITW